ncbi:MAG TPA: hypothetical protein PL151_11890 [Phycisphaerae bacterium]|nr:hypothetical protein [Phycisphaerae bacterium]HOJ75576.1 hypothetical protein [Phycisphaerae bacterium]HOM50230.1 hypothetical protein [Phycisphaerae bacterium]HON64871.1 hypothetical protein [Phycisphaerae bacterium]HPP27535.1 hypothetical protein [Phycisphaerae bacterium]
MPELDLEAVQQSLRSEHALLNSIIDLNPYAIFITDGEGRPLRWNSDASCSPVPSRTRARA